jgi:predicted esterase
MRALIAGFILGLVAAFCGALLLHHFWRGHHFSTTHAAPALATTPEPVSIPRCDNLTPDGNAATWGAQGFRLNVLQDVGTIPGDVPPARASFAWNANAFLVRVEVDVPSTIEAEKDNGLWRDDSVELFLSAGPDLAQISQVIVAPGLDPRHPAPRQMIGRTPAASPKPFPVQTIARRTPTGYAVDFILPWSAYGVTPAAGQKLGVQVVVHHRDDNGLRSFGWYPGSNAYSDPSQRIALVLGQDASPSVDVLARLNVLTAATIQAAVTYSPDARGHVLFLQRGDEALGRYRLGDEGNFSLASFPLPNDWHGDEPIVLRDGGQFLAAMTRDDFLAQIKELASHLEYTYEQSVFNDTHFPKGGFNDDEIVRRFFSPVEIHTKFYDAQYNEVTQADKPGRYGAIVRIRLAGGVELTRYITICRVPKKIDWWNAPPPLNAPLPKEIGLDPAVVRAQQKEIGQDFNSAFLDSMRISQDPAILLAGLMETKPGDAPVVWRTDAWARDANWWYGLREKLGQPEKYQYLLDLPAGYDADTTKNWPLILFLHGSGERGDHVDDVRRNGLAKLLGQGKQVPAIVVSPQCPAGEWWNTHVLAALLDDVAAKYRVDPDRVYVTGLSMGGFCTWDLALAYPERFAAAVPICGRGDPADAARLLKLPLWAFHGEADETVPVANTVDMVTAIRKAGGHPHMTLYPGVGHNSWDKAYATDALYAWLFAQKRGQPEVVTPGAPAQ